MLEKQLGHIYLILKARKPEACWISRKTFGSKAGLYWILKEKLYVCIYKKAYLI